MDTEEFMERLEHKHNVEFLVSRYQHLVSGMAIERLYQRIIFKYRGATVRKFVSSFALRDAQKILSRRMRA